MRVLVRATFAEAKGRGEEGQRKSHSDVCADQKVQAPVAPRMGAAKAMAIVKALDWGTAKMVDTRMLGLSPPSAQAT